jgi:hypothetical protein
LVIRDEDDLKLTSKDRAKLVDEHLVQPAKTLIDALDGVNRRYLSEWPGGELEWIDRHLIPPPKWWLDGLTIEGCKLISLHGSVCDIGHHSTYRQLWLAELRRLQEWAEQKSESLKLGKPQRRPETKFRCELVYDLLIAKVSGQPSVIQNEFVQFIRAAAAPILGPGESLDRQIAEALKRRSAEQKRL